MSALYTLVAIFGVGLLVWFPMFVRACCAEQRRLSQAIFELDGGVGPLPEWRKRWDNRVPFPPLFLAKKWDQENAP